MRKHLLYTRDTKRLNYRWISRADVFSQIPHFLAKRLSKYDRLKPYKLPHRIVSFQVKNIDAVNNNDSAFDHCLMSNLNK